VHEYLRNTEYAYCNSCKNRTQFTCMKCNYCYSCHWKKEKLEKDRLETLVVANSAFLEKYPQPEIIEQSQQLITRQQQHQQQTMVTDVYGQQTEPICNYHTCHHKFSLHGHRMHVCKCSHPLNYVIGISLSISQIKNTDRDDILHKKREDVLGRYD
jgi:hypothetical protein